MHKLQQPIGCKFGKMIPHKEQLRQLQQSMKLHEICNGSDCKHPRNCCTNKKVLKRKKPKPELIFFE